MSLRKIYGGTPVGGESRCDTCVYARIIRGYAQTERITICDRLFKPIHIPFKVMECTDYADKRLPCVEDMEEIAWQLRTKSAGKQAGFLITLQPSESPELQGADGNSAETLSNLNPLNHKIK